MATVDELYDDLCASVSLENDVAAGVDGLTAAPGGIVTTALLTWAVAQARKLTCENRAVIQEAALKFISEKIANPLLAAAIEQALLFALDQACPVTN